MVHYLENQFYPEVVEKLSVALQAQGYHVLLFMAQRTVGDVGPVVQDILDYHAVLATKGRYSIRPEIKAHSLSRRSLHNALDESLQRLQVDTIDLYQLHAADMLTSVEGRVHFLADAVQAGKIHNYGLPNATGWQLQLFVSTTDRPGLFKPVSPQPQ